MTILDRLSLNCTQMDAATAESDVVVTAGAGSGKTRTLVGRYLSLLESEVPLREIVAITFTEKAAREMRTRIRAEITGWLARDPPRRAFWEAAFADLDAAYVGTIHSLCAQILREHPVESARLGVMPGFGVLEEGRAAVLRARAVEDALAWAAEDEAASHLFGPLGTLKLQAVVATLLQKRLDADMAYGRVSDSPLEGWAVTVANWLEGGLNTLGWQEPLETLVDLRADDPTDKLEIARQKVVACAQSLDAARREGDLDTMLSELIALRSATTLVGRKANWPGDTLAIAKDCMRAIRGFYDERFGPLGDAKHPAVWEIDAQVAGMTWALHATYRRALESYAQSRSAENTLDFDDLEAYALLLLGDPGVRTTRQATVSAVLVDEFQDTNERQRQIVYALTGFEQRGMRNVPGAPSTLFVVGDAKQSIYRFRGADVTVFRRVQADIQNAGGRNISLDLTFRAHRDLVQTTNRLLAPILGENEQPDRPYLIPFVPLTAHRTRPAQGIAPPYVEFLLGLGEQARTGRLAATDGLAARLHELRDRAEIDWKDVALLFRASTAFGVYEDALERAGIPFVTVAGRGFYERAEVRQLLNALSAIADPADDLAVAGFLRSPMVALTDPALYALRFPPLDAVPRKEQGPCALWATLNHPALPEILSGEDFVRALQGRALLSDLHEMAGRVPVAALLKRLLDRTHYQAALRAVEGGARARRNVDKLLADAHTSGLVSVREFGEYVHTLRDAGTRESEAPTEAGSAVQLMTVHKAKGLEFPVVVIADAAHRGRRGMERVLLDDRLGVTIDLRDEEERRSATHALASLWDAERDEAEDRRLLYVAATRAREKLLVSGHTKIGRGGGLQMAGWLRRLGEVSGLDEVAMAGTPAEPIDVPLATGIGCRIYPPIEQEGDEEPLPVVLPEVYSAASDVRHDLVAPLTPPPSPDTDSKQRTQDAQPPRHVWRVVPQARHAHAPSWALGTLTHAALRHWRFAGEKLDAFLRPLALEMGIVDSDLIHTTIVDVARMLRRFHAHPLWKELDAAQRWHEVPYSAMVDGRPENGIIDLLYRAGDRFKIAEFKTDRLEMAEQLADHIRDQGYDTQVARYLRAVRRQLGVEAEATWVFLNVGNQVVVRPAP